MFKNYFIAVVNTPTILATLSAESIETDLKLVNFIDIKFVQKYSKIYSKFSHNLRVVSPKLIQNYGKVLLQNFSKFVENTFKICARIKKIFSRFS